MPEAEVGDLRALVLVLDQDPDRVRVLQHVAAVARRAVRVDRRPDRADPPQRVVEQGPLEVRLREDPEGVALADSECEQPVGDLLDCHGRLVPRDLLPAGLALDQVRGVLASPRGRVAPQAPDRPHELSLRWEGKRGVTAKLPGPTRLIHSGPMRTTWNGSLSFGLVTIPVGLAPATAPKARASDVTFRTLHRECGTPIKQKRWCPVHEREVSNDELVKGWEVSKGQFVIVEDADLEAIEQRDTSRAIEISRFVPLAEVDPLFFDRTYFLAPSSAEAQRKPYVLLLNAMKETGMAAIGRMVIRGNENFVLIRPKDDALVLETLFLAEDVRSQAEIDEAVEGIGVSEPELDLARQLIDSLVGEWEPDDLHSEYRENLREMLEAKLAGEEIAMPEPVADAPVVDLMEALKKSVAASKKRDGAKPAAERKKAAPRKRAAAK